ncbi:hypothetical protein IQ265_09610 [Nodosilinea sp. LEGE 06152]|uniref:hypothetical protein n=1 Tax=Nodosilinea sp. LEGE 06152 TaxID=2777966 RepID=UPI0018803924|nr:hypothetical protein [Nodosilinea sp. LEGE 06152]MBE9157080.1 hypothetical protein [Nodosilinea sp. LEGE 06152]
MAQGVHVLVAGGTIPEPEEPGQAAADGIEGIVEQAGAAAGLQGQAVPHVFDKGLNAVGFDVGEDFELPGLEPKSLGFEAFLEGNGQVKGIDPLGKGNVQVQAAAPAGANQQGAGDADGL